MRKYICCSWVSHQLVGSPVYGTDGSFAGSVYFCRPSSSCASNYWNQSRAQQRSLMGTNKNHLWYKWEHDILPSLYRKHLLKIQDIIFAGMGREIVASSLDWFGITWSGINQIFTLPGHWPFVTYGFCLLITSISPQLVTLHGVWSKPSPQ